MTKGKLRRLWFQIHKWIGLALLILLIPISLSGSILLGHDWIEEEEAGEAVTPPLPLSRYVDAARVARPGERIVSISMPSGESPAVRVRMTAATAGERAAPASVWLDAKTGRTAEPGEDDEFFEGTLHRFHGSLLVRGIGRQIVGWCGVAMLLSSLTGLWLWWPTIGAWTRGLHWRRGRALDFNLHHMVGFWIALPLAALSLTGAWISFPSFFSALAGEQAPRRPMGMNGDRTPVAAPKLSVDAVAARMSGPVGQIDFPSGTPALWHVRLGGEEHAPQVRVDDATGAVLPPQPPRGGPVMRAMRAVHEGAESTGPVWRLIAVLGGVAPAVLGITGLTMWLRSRRWRGEVAVRQAAKR